MDIFWLTKAPGMLAVNEEEHAVVIGHPDWVRAPAELGGAQLRVVGVTTEPCPKNGCHRNGTHLATEGGLFVAECEEHGFSWYTYEDHESDAVAPEVPLRTRIRIGSRWLYLEPGPGARGVCGVNGDSEQCDDCGQDITEGRVTNAGVVCTCGASYAFDHEEALG